MKRINNKISFFFLTVAFFTLTGCMSCYGQPEGPHTSQRILPGAERTDLYFHFLERRRVAIFANQTSLLGNRHLVDSLQKRGIQIQKIFSPEHGFRGKADAGESLGNQIDSATGIPVVSLYGKKTRPSEEDLQDVDLIVFDVQDVGVRFYTYISSLQLVLESALAFHKPVLLLDRPNPNGFYVDGPVLEPDYRSFVGMQPVPVVYGMTLGEYARMLIGQSWIAGASDHSFIQVLKDPAEGKRALKLSEFSLSIVPCAGYTHRSLYRLPVKPSPNLPNMLSVYLYPSLCFFEGTEISLGRGTEYPFQVFGNPRFPSHLFSFTPQATPGAQNPPWKGTPCFGFSLKESFDTLHPANKLQLKFLLEAYRLLGDSDHFFLSSHFFDKLVGSALLAAQIRDGAGEAEIRKSWEPGIRRFLKIRKNYLIYPDFE